MPYRRALDTILAQELGLGAVAMPNLRFSVAIRPKATTFFCSLNCRLFLWLIVGDDELYYRCHQRLS